MSRIRSFAKADIPQVTDLYREVFLNGGSSAGLTAEATTNALQSYFNDIFFHNPWSDDDLHSLVYETEDGKITGFLGIIPRRMSLRGRPIRVALSMHFMVEPGRRSSLAGVQLLKALLSGPQDLALTDGAGEVGRKVWEGLGGSAAPVYGLNWTRVLQPSQYALHLVGQQQAGHRPWLSSLLNAFQPVGRIADALASRFLPRHFHLSATSLTEEELTNDKLLECINRFSANDALRPEYDEHSLPWLLKNAERLGQRSKLQSVLLRNGAGEIVGWFLYYLNPAGLSDVLQVAARRGATSEVLDHLFHHAQRLGAWAITGRLEPKLMPELTDKHCYLRCNGPWVLVHSREPDLLHVINQGQAFLSRLEGDWCLRFQGKTN